MTDPIRPAAAAISPLLCALLVLACGAGDSGGGPGITPEPPAEPIVLGVFGGYPPNSFQVRVDPKGVGSAVARGPASDFELGPPRRGGFTLAEEELADLRGRLAAAEIGTIDPGEQTCADCLIYELRYGDDEFSSDMLTIPAELKGPIHLLERLGGRALPPARPAPGER